MNRYLKKGQVIKMPEKQGYYRIEQLAGSSPLGVVYKTIYSDESGKKSVHFLQEYNPKFVGVQRNPVDNAICISEKEEKKFMRGLQDFMQCYNFQKQEFYNAYGTWYVDTCGTPEACYVETEERDLGSFLQRMERVTEVIGKLHGEGYLHLNVNPESIYTSWENPEDVCLLDFGSIVQKREIEEEKILFSYDRAWAAPELKAGNRKDICEATDLFPIGEMIFCAINGRHSYPEERRSFSIYEAGRDLGLLEGATTSTFERVKEILSKTICNVPEKRYQHAAELAESLRMVRFHCGI